MPGAKVLGGGRWHRDSVFGGAHTVCQFCLEHFLNTHFRYSPGKFEHVHIVEKKRNDDKFHFLLDDKQ